MVRNFRTAWRRFFVCKKEVRKIPKHIDLSGKRFHRLTVLREDGRIHGRPAFVCRCDCGNVVRTNASELNASRVQSCGCLQREKASQCLSAMKTTHGKSNSRLYAIWSSMKLRCLNRNCKEYRLYGGRGISICEEWLNDFYAFYTWAFQTGYEEDAPRGQCTIDRIDVDGDYCPENCRWVTQIEQCNNRQKNRYVEVAGQCKTIAEWARVTGIPYRTIWDRLKSGWSPSQAVSQPPRRWPK